MKLFKRRFFMDQQRNLYIYIYTLFCLFFILFYRNYMVKFIDTLCTAVLKLKLKIVKIKINRN